VLQSQRQPAGLGVDAQPRQLTVPVGQRDVEHLHVDLADVAAHPVLEDVDEEPAVASGGDRTPGDQVPLLDIQRPVACPLAPAGVGSREGLLGGPLDDGSAADILGGALR